MRLHKLSSKELAAESGKLDDIMSTTVGGGESYDAINHSMAILH